MKKFCKEYFYYHLLIDFVCTALVTAYVAFSASLSFTEDGITAPLWVYLIFAGVGLLVYGGLILYRFYYVKTSFYTLNEKEMECGRGVLFKKRSILEYSKMHAINKRQNIFQKLFKVAVLTVDSGSTNTAHTAEILVIEKEEIVNALLKELKLRQSGKTVTENDPFGLLDIDNNAENTEKHEVYTFDKKSKWVYSLLNALSTITVCGICALALMGVGALIYYIIPLIPYGFLRYFMSVVIGLITLSVAVSLIALLGSYLGAILGFYNFKVIKTDSAITVSYGLFVQSTNTFELSKIKGVKISQGLIKRLFGYVAVSLEVIGYGVQDATSNGDNKKANGGAYFIPLIKAKFLIEVLDRLLPEFLPEERDTFAKYYKPFVLWRALFTFVGFVVPYAILLVNLILFEVGGRIILGVSLCVLAIFIFLNLIYLWEALLQKENAGIKISENKITVYSGGFIKKATVIKYKNVIAIEDITTVYRAKNGVYSYNIHFRSNANFNKVKVKNIDEQTKNKLLEVLTF